MKRDKAMLIDAIRNAEIIPPKQKLALEVICASDYPITSKMLEKKLNTTKQRMDYSLKSLLKRNFIIKEKDGHFVYSPNYSRMDELVKRYENS